MGIIDKNHYLAIGVNGGYSNNGAYRSSPEQVQTIVEYLKHSDIQELTIYAHGGLVAEQDAEQAIDRILKALADRGMPRTEGLGLIWKTGFIETIRDNLREIFTSKFGKNLLKWVIRAASKKLAVESVKGRGGQGLTLEEIETEWERATIEHRRPFADLEVTFAAKAKGVPLRGINEDDGELIATITAELQDQFEKGAIQREDWSDAPEHIHFEPELEEIFHSDKAGLKGFSAYQIAKAVVKVAVRVIRRHLNGTDHGLQATVVEEACRTYFISDAGQWVWGEMKSKAGEMWQKEGRVGFDFLRSLQYAIPGIRLNLVGHSAGSICHAQLLKRIREEQWNVTVNKILWLAPACGSELFVDEVVKHRAGYRDFRMITMADRYELEDNLVNAVPWLYPSSLLYFISGVLEGEVDYPICGMARYHSASGPYTGPMFTAVKEFLDEQGRLVLSETEGDALPGFRSQAVDHGAFDEDEYTLHSVTEYLRQRE